MTSIFAKPIRDFIEQDIIRFVNSTKGISQPTYVPDEGGAEMRVLDQDKRRENEIASLYAATHEIGHFVLVSEERLASTDYGFPEFRPEITWSIRMVRAELEVFAIQARIYQAAKRYTTAEKTVHDGIMFFAAKSPKYIESVESLHLVADTRYGPDCHLFWNEVSRHAHKESQTLVEAAPSYEKIVSIFYERLAMTGTETRDRISEDQKESL